MNPLAKMRRGADRVARPILGQMTYARRALSNDQSVNLIRNKIEEGTPTMVARMGATEQAVFRRYMLINRLPLRGHRPLLYGPSLISELCTTTGFFPGNARAADQFGAVYEAALEDVDIYGIWNNRGEWRIVRDRLPPDAACIPLSVLTPLPGDLNWLSSLEGKRILVVHPFAESIGRQIHRLDAIFPAKLWPRCDIVVQKAVQSIGGGDGSWPTWFEALEHMKDNISSVATDVVLVGAGAYGLPLVHHAKQEGRVGILVGGALQILFGIRGRRWDRRADFASLVNDNWVRPQAHETPRRAELVEGGCYW